MKTQNLKNLNRKELLQILLMQAEEIKRLENELAEAKQELENREIVMKKTGSIADASLQLSGIFDAAEAAARLYVESIEKMAAEKVCDYESMQNMNQTQLHAYSVISKANIYAKRKQDEADEYYNKMRRKTVERGKNE